MKLMPLVLIPLILFSSCGNLRTSGDGVPAGRVLVAYFSLEGNSIVSGDPSSPDAITPASVQRSGNSFPPQVVDGVHKGNTQIVAKQVAKATGGDLVEITVAPEYRYPTDAYEVLDLSGEQLGEGIRPLLTTEFDLDGYDVIYLGYPIWHGTFPTPVSAFLEGNDFSGKTIVPFCTHDGSRAGRSKSDIESICPDATVLDVMAIRYSDVQDSKDEIDEWIRSIR